jgi:hypothetical protein
MSLPAARALALAALLAAPGCAWLDLLKDDDPGDSATFSGAGTVVASGTVYPGTDPEPPPDTAVDTAGTETADGCGAAPTDIVATDSVYADGTDVFSIANGDIVLWMGPAGGVMIRAGAQVMGTDEPVEIQMRVQDSVTGELLDELVWYFDEDADEDCAWTAPEVSLYPTGPDVTEMYAWACTVDGHAGTLTLDAGPLGEPPTASTTVNGTLRALWIGYGDELENHCG